MTVLTLAAATLAGLAVSGRRAGPGAPAAAKAPLIATLGAYTGSGRDGAGRQVAFQDWLGQPVRYALDYGSAAGGWSGIVQPDAALSAWQKAWAGEDAAAEAATGSASAPVHRRLVYSVQLFPTAVGQQLGHARALQQCAAGADDQHWATLARTLLRHGMPDTIVRPGWEMNGDWFDWSAGGHEQAYIGCFRHLVDAMRAVPGQHFTFTWNVAIGPSASAAEKAWPGDAYVDDVGVDIFDWTWATGVYGNSAQQSTAQRAQAVRTAWATKLNGDHGLRYWAAFAQAHGATLSFPEWGLARRFVDDNGGGDNPYFIAQMLAFIADPAHHVRYACYFNTVSQDADHRLTPLPGVRGGTPFPDAAALYRRTIQSATAAPSATALQRSPGGSPSPAG